MVVQCYRPIPDDAEAIAIRLTAHGEEDSVLTGIELVVRWHKTPNEQKNMTWSGKPEVHVEGPTSNRSPEEIGALYAMLGVALQLCERITDDPTAFDGEPQEWTVDVDPPEEPKHYGDQFRE